MGVRGFTTYMAKHSHLFHELYELKDCYVIIDGSGIAINLYVWHTKTNDCFGGDYDSYANVVYQFFNLLKQCDVVPIILFDGGYEKRKMKTVFSRMRSRIGAIKRLNSTSGDVKVYPLFTKEIFQDIALKLGIKCIRNDHESDSEVACLGNFLRSPILGYDSDFYFFDTLYIPFNTFQMKAVGRFDEETKRTEYHIPCEVYKIDNFLYYFGGLDKTNLPLLPVLLGNDYVKKSMFSAFYKHIKLKKSRADNEQQRLIKTVICWLRHETLESAISKILGRFQTKKRRFILFKLESAMKGYLQISSTITEYLEDMGFGLCQRERYAIDVMNIKPSYEDLSDDEIEDAVGSSESEEEDLKETLDQDGDLEDLDVGSVADNVTDDDVWFVETYRRCLLPQCFADIKKNIYFCLPLIENYSDPTSYRASLNILTCIHKMLNPGTVKPLTCVLRNDSGIKREQQNLPSSYVPELCRIRKCSVLDRKLALLKILEIDEEFLTFLDMFPSDWILFLISLYYWKKKSEKVIDTSYIYSLILCSIIINFVDLRTGFLRSTTAFNKKFRIIKNFDALKPEPEDFIQEESIIEAIDNIEYGECIICLKTMIRFFSKQPKKAVDKKLSEASVVGYFSEFQSCALHIKYLNALLEFPFENLLFSKFFCGTFLYNAVVDFRRRSNLKCYIEGLLKDCQNFDYVFKLMIKRIEEYFGEISESDAKKRRKKKKKQNKKETPDEEEEP